MSEAASRLDARSRALLEFERDWPAHEGRKQQAIRETFEVSAARYYQLIERLLDRPEAYAFDPLLVRRLRRRRDDRGRKRATSALGERPGQ